MDDETTPDEVPKCSREVLGLLWRALGLRGCDDGLTLKGGLVRRFKKLMVDALLYIELPNGDVRTRLDPRGGLQLPPRKAQVFTPTVPEAIYLKECVKELKEKRNADGSPFIDATVADHIEEIEESWLALWLAETAKVPVKPGEAA